MSRTSASVGYDSCGGALQKRANELAATMVEPLLLQAEFGAMRERLHMPPALPGEEALFNEEN